MLLRSLETKHLRINIRRLALSLNNLQTGYGSNPSATACCFPREFTRHWPPIFGMKLLPFSRLPARPVSRNGARKSEQKRQGSVSGERRIRSIGRNNARFARDGSYDFSTCRIITSNTADDTQAIRRLTYARAREYITHCIPINRSAVNGDITARLNARNLYNDAGERCVEDVMELRGWLRSWLSAQSHSPCFLANQRASSPNLVTWSNVNTRCNCTEERNDLGCRNHDDSSRGKATRKLEILARYY